MPAPSPHTPASAGRMPGLDGLRGLAALAVVVLHVWMYTDANSAGRPDLLDAVIGEMRVAVGLFFVLSGFLLARPWMAAGMLGGWPPETMWTLPTYLGLFACGIGTAVLVHARRPGRALSAGLLGGGWALVAWNGWWHHDGTGLAGHVL